MIDARQALGNRSAKWSKHQPDKVILWSNKLIRGSGGADKSYIALHLDTYSLIHIEQLWDSKEEKVVWQVFSGENKKIFKGIEEAKQFVKEFLGVRKGVLK